MSSEAEERIRVKAEAHLRALYPGSRIIHELKLNDGATRIDLAAVLPTRLAVGEIKSERDVLDRLGRQLEDSLRITANVHVYVSGKHVETLKEQPGDVLCQDNLRSMLWRTSVWAETADGFSVVHRAYDHQRAELGHMPDTRQLLSLLWADELKTMLDRHSLSYGRRATMQFTKKVALEHMTGAQIRAGVCQALMGRPFARADQQILEARP